MLNGLHPQVLYGLHLQVLYGLHLQVLYGLHLQVLYGLHLQVLYGLHPGDELFVVLAGSVDLWFPEAQRMPQHYMPQRCMPHTNTHTRYADPRGTLDSNA